MKRCVSVVRLLKATYTVPFELNRIQFQKFATGLLLFIVKKDGDRD